VEHLSEERKKSRKNIPVFYTRKEHFYLLNNVHHGDKHKINNGIFEHKATSTA
jgi:hypothetical protein